MQQELDGKKYDVVILGAGLGGTAMALVASRTGLKVLVIERDSHPRFAIGESMLLTTGLIFKDLSVRYDIPELEMLANYPRVRAAGCAAYPKLHTWFGLHREGENLAPEHEAMFETVPLPYGPDLHLLRSEVDEALVRALPRYGIDYVDEARVLERVYEDGANRLRVEKKGDEFSVQAPLLIDAGGYHSFLARELNLRHDETRLKTNTRAVFAHLRGANDVDEVMGSGNPDFWLKRSAGTMHHMLPGGWAWMIPFSNDVCSAGIVLDREAHPRDANMTPEEEVARIRGKFPTLDRVLRGAETVTAWRASERIQYTSRAMVGDGFVLMPHATAFVDPLYSSGILFTAAFTDRCAELLKSAFAQGDFSRGMWRPLETAFFAELEHIDMIVRMAIDATCLGFDVYKQCWRVWVYASNIQYAAKCLAPTTPASPFLYGTGIAAFERDLREIYGIVHRACAPGESADGPSVAAEIKSILDPWEAKYFSAFADEGVWNPDRHAAVNVRYRGDTRSFLSGFLKHYPGVSETNIEERLKIFGEEARRFKTELDESKGDFREHVNFILSRYTSPMAHFSLPIFQEPR